MALMKETDEAVSKLFNQRPQKEALAGEDFDIIVDKKTSKVWVLHERPFLNQKRVDRAEYERNTCRLRFVSRDGTIQYLGETVQEPLRSHLEKAANIAAVLVDKSGNILDLTLVPLMQKKTKK